MANKIDNLDVYLSRMQNGMEDKLWFVDKIITPVIVDFGCADGTLLKHLSNINPELVLIGVDNSEDMLEIAKKNVPNAAFFNVEEFFDIHFDYSNATLIMSSVIHEIYSYIPSPDHFLKRLFDLGFKHICIRDMFVSMYDNRNADVQMTTALLNDARKKQLADFMDVWGGIENKENCIHYLLKYRYKENWKREVRENYLPVYIEDFIRFLSDNYQCIYLEHYTLPYLKEKIKKDFKIEFNEKTHCKIMFESR
jgi:SAM-dependent methyltransferase